MLAPGAAERGSPRPRRGPFRRPRAAAPALLTIILLLLAPLLPGRFCAAAETADPVAQAEQQISALEAQLKQPGKPGEKQIEAMLATLKEVYKVTRSCIDDVAEKQQALERELKILAPDGAGESANGDLSKAGDKPAAAATIDSKRAPLQEQLGKLEARQANCQLLRLRGTELESAIGNLKQQLLTRQLMTRLPNLLQIIERNLAEPQKWVNFSSTVLMMSTGAGTVHGAHLLAMAAAGLLAWLAGLFIRRKLRPLAAAAAEGEQLASGFYHSLLASIAHYAPPLLLFGAFSLYLELALEAQAQRPFFVLLINGLLFYLLATAGIRTFLWPRRPAAPYLALPVKVARAVSRRLQMLALLLLLGKLLLVLGEDGLLDENMLYLARSIWSFVLVLNLVWILWLMQRLERWRGLWGISLLLSLIFASGLLASWLGYRALGIFIIFGLLGTLIALGLTLIGSGLLTDLFDGLDQGRHAWQRKLRRAVGIEDGGYLPGLGWLRLLAGTLLWLGFALFTLYIWDMSEQSFPRIQLYFFDGFEFAGLTIVPSRLLFAVLVLALLLTLSRRFTDKLNSSWLQKTRMERGAREALIAFSRYTIIALVILFALSLAGIEFSKLAIIAGALSVGIGFGLQNVVNNFVSGLILLFERPVRTGDWIVVGTTQGTVKRISIRSTVVQTFERADVIVPNSELISGQVTNWTLDTPWARLSVPVGVAYGSDTEKVKKILLEIAGQHPLVVTDHPQWPRPSALFMAFGASSLDFELRVIIRDILYHAQVRSDLNFAIDKAFREQGIEIPFPQQDVHLKQVPDALRREPPAPPADHGHKRDSDGEPADDENQS